MFGHNSQLPQIFAGFGIKTAFLWRGNNISNSRNFIWKGADGTGLVCYRFGRLGYSTYAIEVRGAHTSKKFSTEDISKNIDKYIESESQSTEIEPLLFFDGSDHNKWDSVAYKALFDRKDLHNKFEIIHSDLDVYSKEMLASSGNIKTVLEGELREPGKVSHNQDTQLVITGVLSSRVSLKQKNRYCETLLCNWAEPFSAFATLALGNEYPEGFLNVAWRWLLQNHAHDSIDGCSIDQVHREMEYRFSQAEQIGNCLLENATSEISAFVEGILDSNSLKMVVFNPSARDIDRVVEIELRIPENWKKMNELFGYEPMPVFRIYDRNGIEIPYQYLSKRLDVVNSRIKPDGTDVYKTNNVRIALKLSIPAVGYASFIVKGLVTDNDFVRYSKAHSLATSEHSMSNEKLTVTIESNGTLTLTDKSTGQTYNRLLTFEDTADIGDGWYHGKAVNDETFLSTACNADISLVHDGPMCTTFRLRQHMKIPIEFDFSPKMVRSNRFAELIIDNFISLRAGQEYLDVTTSVYNVAGDHRLRILMPSGTKANTYLADSQFDVIERPIELRHDNHLYREMEVDTKPQVSWTAVFDKNRGLAVIADGLLETAVMDNPDRTIAMTLFRATRRTVFTEGEPDGQLKTEMKFRYRIMPVTSEVSLTKLCELGQDISAGLRVVQMQETEEASFLAKEAYNTNTIKRLPPRGSFLRLTGPGVITSIQVVHNGIEVRMFNPERSSIHPLLELSKLCEGTSKVSSRSIVDLESNSVSEEIPKCAALTLKPKQIMTVRLEMK